MSTITVVTSYPNNPHHSTLDITPVDWNGAVPREAFRIFLVEVRWAHATSPNRAMQIRVHWYRHWLMRFLLRPLLSESLFQWEPVFQRWVFLFAGCRARVVNDQEERMLRQLLEAIVDAENNRTIQDGS